MKIRLVLDLVILNLIVILILIIILNLVLLLLLTDLTVIIKCYSNTCQYTYVNLAMNKQKNMTKFFLKNLYFIIINLVDFIKNLARRLCLLIH